MRLGLILCAALSATGAGAQEVMTVQWEAGVIAISLADSGSPEPTNWNMRNKAAAAVSAAATPGHRFDFAAGGAVVVVAAGAMRICDITFRARSPGACWVGTAVMSAESCLNSASSEPSCSDSRICFSSRDCWSGGNSPSCIADSSSLSKFWLIYSYLIGARRPARSVIVVVRRLDLSGVPET